MIQATTQDPLTHRLKFLLAVAEVPEDLHQGGVDCLKGCKLSVIARQTKGAGLTYGGRTLQARGDS